MNGRWCLQMLSARCTTRDLQVACSQSCALSYDRQPQKCEKGVRPSPKERIGWMDEWMEVSSGENLCRTKSSEFHLAPSPNGLRWKNGNQDKTEFKRVLVWQELARTMKGPTTQELHCKGFLLAAGLLFLWLPAAAGVMGSLSIVSVPETPVEGQNVTLLVENVTGSIREITWFRGPATDGSSRILSYFPGNSRPQRNGIQNTQREFGFPNGSLLITGVRPSFATSPPRPTGPTTEMPPIRGKPHPPLMLGWIVAGVVVGILLSGAVGAILVYRFLLNKEDPGTGSFGVQGAPMEHQPIRSRGKDLDTLILADASHPVQITPSGNVTWLLGSPLTLRCSADSVPAPCYCWFFNKTSVNVNGTNLTIHSTSWENEGVYECCVHNLQTNSTACNYTFLRIKNNEGAATRQRVSLPRIGEVNKVTINP
ncbi:hypothetical protein JRQ81_011501 [Phrynocephalus forsythii]|uniref:Ig-like domain-containing protein n=1 Tax=Phrynocephalus forsythii TaxID=171643 RepID=A0A9Q0X975_9SAUR|nr:hypothetical protein JRQ81_011501 [Phrynocephalus forsythii]